MTSMPYCLGCGKKLKHKWNIRCRKCSGQYRAKLISGERHYRYKHGGKHPCIDCSNIIKCVKPRRCIDCYKKFRKANPIRGYKRPHTEAWLKKMHGRIPWNKGKRCPQLSGRNNGGWKDGRYSSKLYKRMRRKLLRELGGYTPGKIQEVIEKTVRAHGRLICTYCFKNLLINKVIIEHMTPLSRGGDNSLENLTTSCRSCNSSKHSKTVEEWRACKK